MWSASTVDQLLAGLGATEKKRPVAKKAQTTPEEWHVDKEQARINSGPERPHLQTTKQTLSPLQGQGVENPDDVAADISAASVAPPPAPQASATAVHAIHTPLVALCADEAEAYLLTPLLKALARANNRCTLLYTNGKLAVEALE